MSRNPLWGAPRIHGELLKPGEEISEATVAKYMKRRRPGGRPVSWKTFRRECTDMIIPLSAYDLRRALKEHADYYNNDRTHLGLDKDAPRSRAVEAKGTIVSRPILGGLHHRYSQI